MTMFLTPGARHIEVFRQKAEAAGRPLPITVSIGIDPAISLATSFEPPSTPLGFDELRVAGALRGAAVDLVQGVSVDERAVAHAEFVIEGELLPGVRMAEDQNTGTGKAMPEFPGYTGPAVRDLPVIRVKAVTHRRHPILQTCIGPSEEHVSLAGIPTEASILQAIDRAMPGRLVNVYAHSSGGGKYLAILQFRKGQASDEGRQRQAALIALTAFPELKHVIVVDEDVDPFDTNDVLWALNTRYQGDIDTLFLPGVRCHPLDPSESPAYNPSLRDTGLSCKTIFDCTVPWALKGDFVRTRFLEVDPRRFPLRPLD
jgi:4-hydroxy-3-polyprenylbenzoate decarboxylase